MYRPKHFQLNEHQAQLEFIDQNNDGNYWLVYPYDAFIDPSESDFYIEDDWLLYVINYLEKDYWYQ